jgi:lipopolysaccharide export system permease protein
MLLAFVIVVFILIMQMLWRYIDDLVGKGLETSVIAEFMFWATLNVIPLALPLSVLFASIMTMGNLGGSNELLALKSAGLSLVKILRPMFFVAMFITMFAFYVADNVMPYAMMKIYSVFWDIKNKRPDAQIIPGVFCALEDNVIKVATKDPKTNKMTGILLYQHPAGKGNVALIVADSGYIKTEDNNMIVTLYNGVSYEDATSAGFSRTNNNFSFQKRTFDKHTLIVDLSKNKMQRTDAELFRSQYTTMKSAELTHLVDSVSEIQKTRVDNFWMEYNQSQALESHAEIDTVMQYVNVNENKNKLSYTINIDSAFNKFSHTEKTAALQYALEKSTTALTTMSMITTEITNNETNIRKARIEWHYKFTLSIACFIFFLIGAPFGAIIRKGGLGMPTVASLLIFIAYFILSTITKKMATQGVIPVTFAMWFADALFLPLGIFLMVKAKNDSALFDKESYKKYLKIFASLLSMVGIKFNVDTEDDVKNYYKPSTINNTVTDKQTLLKMFETFDNDVIDFCEKVKSDKYDEQDIKDFNKRYDNMLSVLWGIDKKELKEVLKNYPPAIDLSIFKTEAVVKLQMIHSILIERLEQIIKNKELVENIINHEKFNVLSIKKHHT